MANIVESWINPKKFCLGLDLGPPTGVTAAHIKDMPAPERLYLPLKQHKGAWCEPKVRVGDQVRIGQVLGESADPDAAPVHASVSGQVIAIGDHMDPFGRKVPTITIANDGEDQWLTEPVDDPEFMKRRISVLMRQVRRSGVVKARSGRPVAAMLFPPERPKAYIFLVGIPLFKPIQIMIASALDVEPTLAANRRLLLERPAEVRAGITLLKKILGCKSAVLVVGDDMLESTSTFKEALDQDIQLCGLANRYPVAYPELLTPAVTSRELPWPGGDTRDVGTLVLDIEAILAVYDAVRSGRPQIDRVVTVRGAGIPSFNLRVRLGTPLGEVLKYAGGSYDHSAKIVVGGLMTGAAQYTELAPVTKEVRALNALRPNEVVEISEQLCIKCGRCVKVCPMRLLPNVITNYCEFGYFSEAEDAELFKCIECGCCGYICPAKRPLVHYVKHGKAEILAKRAAQ